MAKKLNLLTILFFVLGVLLLLIGVLAHHSFIGAFGIVAVMMSIAGSILLIAEDLKGGGGDE